MYISGSMQHSSLYVRQTNQPSYPSKTNSGPPLVCCDEISCWQPKDRVSSQYFSSDHFSFQPGTLDLLPVHYCTSSTSPCCPGNDIFPYWEVRKQREIFL